MVTSTVDVPVGEELLVTVGPGSDEWAYRVTVSHGGETITTYGSDFQPWGRAGITILRNIVMTRIDGFDSRDWVEDLLVNAFESRREDLDALGGD